MVIPHWHGTRGWKRHLPKNKVKLSKEVCVMLPDERGRRGLEVFTEVKHLTWT
jgi:hypothetical protein